MATQEKAQLGQEVVVTEAMIEVGFLILTEWLLANDPYRKPLVERLFREMSLAAPSARPSQELRANQLPQKEHCSGQ